MTSITVRMDQTVKEQASSVVEALGMDLPTAIRMFAKQIAVTRSVPLSLSLDNADYGVGYVRKLDEAVAAYNRGEVQYHDLIEAGRMGAHWLDSGWQEYVAWQVEDRKTLRRINKLIDDARRNGHKGMGKPEALVGNHKGWYSRRIDERNRLVYRIDGEDVVIASCRGHYGDKGQYWNDGELEDLPSALYQQYYTGLLLEGELQVKWVWQNLPHPWYMVHLLGKSKFSW